MMYVLIIVVGLLAGWVLKSVTDEIFGMFAAIFIILSGCLMNYYTMEKKENSIKLIKIFEENPKYKNIKSVMEIRGVSDEELDALKIVIELEKD